MVIYVVQSDDTIESIAKKYGVTVETLIQDNGLSPLGNLVLGQALVVTYPKQTHIVQQGETLDSIAKLYNVTTMQLLRNNPFLNREMVFPQQTLVISYETIRSITTNGFCYPYINQNTLVRTLPNLTYLSIFNYLATKEGAIISHQDDTYLLKTAKDYNVIPLMLLTTLTPYGKENIELAFQILLNEDFQLKHIEQFTQIMKNKGYLGINIIFYYLNEENQDLYLSFVKRVSARLRQEGFLFFLTINYNVLKNNNQTSDIKVDYSKFEEYIDGFIFIRFVWGTNFGPPAPVSNINTVRELIKNVSTNIPVNKINIGKPVIGYDWSLPYLPNISSAYSLSVSSVLGIAYETNSTIQFDEVSQTPYFYYDVQFQNVQIQHIIWFIDARSLDALDQIIVDYSLNGSAIWNIMVYNPQLWTIINSTFDVIKLI